MEEFYLKVYLFRPNRVPPIKIARNSQLKITIETMDYTIPEGSTASAFAKGAFSDRIYTQICTVEGNRVSFTPQPGFFVQGRNVLQYEINNGVIPLAIDVSCEISLPDGGEATTPEQVLPYVQRAENAANLAGVAANNAEESKTAAARYAEAADSSAGAADDSAGAAAGSAEAAANAANAALQSETSADESAQAAEESKNAAAGSASDAACSAGAAAGSAEVANQRATDAENAATKAEESKNAAGESEAAAKESADKAAASLENVLEKEQSAVNAAGSAAQSLVGANAAASDAQRYSAEAKDFANTAAGYAGAATVSIGWDADGYFSIFEQEE